MENSKITMWIVLGIVVLATMIYFAPESQPRTPTEAYLDCMQNQWVSHIQDGQVICQPIIDNFIK